MTEKELIGKIRELRQIQPKRDWVILTKNQILGGVEVRPQPFLFFRPAYAGLIGLMVIFVLFGLFGFAQNSLPGDFLYPLRKITEKSRLIFVSETEKPAFQLEQVNKRLEDLNHIIEANQVRKLAVGLEELKVAKTEAGKEVAELRDKPAKEAISIAKKIAPKVKDLNEKEKRVYASLNIEPEKEVNQRPEKTITELLIRDLENRTLTTAQQELLAEAKKNFEAGNFTQALEKILILSYPQE